MEIGGINLEQEEKEIIDRVKFFQQVQALPIQDEFNYKQWLKNFEKGKPRYLATLLLDYFTFYNQKMVKHLLRSAVQYALHNLSGRLPAWNHALVGRCIFSYFPGEEINISDSGPYFTRMLKKTLGVDENNLVRFEKIYDELKARGGLTPVIFIDDFVGSGNQCYVGWNKKPIFDGMTLAEIAKDNKFYFVYAPLVANYIGYESIITHCENLSLTPAHVLGKEYSLFDEKCRCWRNNKDLHAEGVSFILEISKNIGIPFTDGTEVNDVRGYNNQGLAIGFEDSYPDSNIPLLYWYENDWTPLIKKNYER